MAALFRSAHIACLLALALAGCATTLPHTVSKVKDPSAASNPDPVGVAGLIGEAGSALISNNGGALTGRSTIPAGIIANNAGSLVSDSGGSIIANNAGGLVSDSGGGLISNHGSSYHTLAVTAAPAAHFTVTLVDANNKPVLDADGKVYQTTTGEDGSYTFAHTPRGHNLVVRLDLPVAVGAMLAYLPDASAGTARTADVSGASTLVMGYVLAKFVDVQTDPIATLQKLPADVEAATRATATTALGDGASLASFRPEALVPTVETLEAANTAFAQQVDAVRKLLIAGLSDVGEGQAATSVALSVPRGVVRMSDGSLLVCERDGHRIRRIDARTGLITTYAGKDGATGAGDGGPATEAFIDRPVALAIDPQDNVYVCDFGHETLRRIDAVTHQITDVAGSGTPPQDQDPQLLAGAKASTANLKYPAAVAIDGQGHVVFKSEYGLFRIEADGTLTPLTGPDDLPQTLAAGPDGAVYSFNYTTGLISKLVDKAFVVQPGAAHAAAGSAQLAIGPDGHYVLTDDDKLYTAAPGGSWSELPFTTTHGQLAGLVVDAIGIAVADAEFYRVWELPTKGGAGVAVAGLGAITANAVSASALSLNRPSTLAATAPGHLLVADGLNSVVWERRPDGLFYRFAGGVPAAATDTDIGDGGPAINAKLLKVIDIVQLKNGTVLLSESDGSTTLRIRQITPDGIISTRPLPDGLLAPAVIAEAADGSLLVSDYLLGKTLHWLDNTLTPALTDTSVQILQPVGLVPLPDGSFYVADAKGNALYKVTQGKATLVAGGNGSGFSGDGGPATAAQLNSPLAIALGPDGNLYTSDARNDRIRRITLATGIIDTVVGTGGVDFATTGDAATPDNSLKEPVGLAFDSTGDLYVADSGHNQVKRVEAAKLK